MKSNRIVLFLVLLLSICGSLSATTLDSLSVPIWSEKDLLTIPDDAKLNVYQVFMEKIPPYYKDGKALSYKSIKSPGGTLLFHEFHKFKNIFIDPFSTIKGARTVDSNGNVIAEAKVRFYSIKDEESGYYQQGRELEEYHYGSNGRLKFYCKSIIDPKSGFKVEETDTIGTKSNEYYFLWPIR